MGHPYPPKEGEPLRAKAEEEKAFRDAEALKLGREFELEKIRLSNVGEVNSISSVRSENNKNRPRMKNLLQKFDAQLSDISLYLTLFERQARMAEIDETEWVPQLISLLPFDLEQIIIKEPEEKMQDYFKVKEDR